MSTSISKPLLKTLQSCLCSSAICCELGVFYCVWGLLQQWAPAKRKRAPVSVSMPSIRHPLWGCAVLVGIRITPVLSFLKTSTVILVGTTTTKTYFQQVQSPFCGYHVCLQNHPLWWILPSKIPCYTFSWSSRTESWQTMFRHGSLDHRLVPKNFTITSFSLRWQIDTGMEWYYQKRKYCPL